MSAQKMYRVLRKLIYDLETENSQLQAKLEKAKEVLKSIIDEGIDTSTDSGMDFIRQALAELERK